MSDSHTFQRVVITDPESVGMNVDLVDGKRTVELMIGTAVHYVTYAVLQQLVNEATIVLEYRGDSP